MPLRNTIIVIALLLVIGGYALYQRYQPPPEKNPKVYALDVKDIQKIELRSPDRDLVLERGAANQWKIIKPVQAEADHFTVDAIANQIAGLEITDTADANPSELAPFGLKVPAVTVTVTTKAGKTLPAILVGGKAPIGNAGFIKLADKPAVLMVSPAFAAMVNKHLDDLRSRAFFTFKPDDAHKIVIVKDQQTLELKRDAGDQWKIVKPRNYAADNTAVTSFLKALGAAQATRFIDDHPADPAKYGLTNPSLAITLARTTNGPEETMRFGFNQPEANANATYARTGDSPDSPVYLVATSVFNLANKGFDDLRDKTVINFDPASVSRLHLVGGPVDETLARSADKKWTISSQNKTAPAELPVATSLLDQLHSLKATKIAQDPMSDPKQFGMATPTMTITLIGKDGKEIGVVRTSILETTQKPESSDQKPTTTATGYVTTSVDPAVFEVNAQAVRDLEQTANRLHSDVLPTPTPSPTSRPSPSPTATPTPH